jgi:hypothetical protein
VSNAVEKATYRKSRKAVYYVESWCGWFLVKCRNMREAKREARLEWASGAKRIKLATQSQIDCYFAMRGEIGEVW